MDGVNPGCFRLRAPATGGMALSHQKDCGGILRPLNPFEEVLLFRKTDTSRPGSLLSNHHSSAGRFNSQYAIFHPSCAPVSSFGSSWSHPCTGKYIFGRECSVHHPCRDDWQSLLWIPALRQPLLFLGGLCLRHTLHDRCGAGSRQLGRSCPVILLAVRPVPCCIDKGFNLC